MLDIRRLLSLAAPLLLLFAAGCATSAPSGHGRATVYGSASDHDVDHDQDPDQHQDHGHDPAHEAPHAPDHAHDHGHAPAVPWQESHGHEHQQRRLLRSNLRCGWRECPDHIHASVCGTPMVHGFLTEPAFIGRDLFADFSRTKNESEVEVEIEFAITRRIGLIAELPFVDGDAVGYQDTGLGLRALFLEYERFLLAGSVEVELPTGDESRGLGEGTHAFGFNLHTWHDLGSWFTAQTQVGLAHVPDADETAMAWGVTLAKSFCTRPLLRGCRGGGAHHHGPEAVSLIAEIAGVTALSDNAGETAGLWLLGVSFPMTPALDLRGAFSRTYGEDEDESAWTLGFILHF